MEKLPAYGSGGYSGMKPVLDAATPKRSTKPEMWEMDVRNGKSFEGAARYPPESVAMDGKERVMSGASSFSGWHEGEAVPRPRSRPGEATPGDRWRDSAMSDDMSVGEWSPSTAVEHRPSESIPPPAPRRASAYGPGPGRSPLAPLPAGAQRPIANLNFPSMHPLPSVLAGPPAQLSKLPPPGYAKAILLPGRTIRLSLITSRRFAWSPGQHVLLMIPSISRFTSHPFTIASVSDSAIAGPQGREMVLVIRAKKGFTKKLWDAMKEQSTQNRSGLDGKAGQNSGPYTTGGYFDEETGQTVPLAQGTGVTFRAWVDGPFGSAVRAHWGSHSSVVIVCGGSGVSFGTSILEYLCLCLNGRDGRSLGGRSGGVGKDSFITRRVRFIWLIREYCECTSYHAYMR